MPESAEYRLTIALHTLEHLGIGLYSNVPAVVAEAVSNSYDADATWVHIDIEPERGTIRITDNGWGMTKEDANAKFLTVGYNKRDKESPLTPKKRKPMGRKGIGKLSLFSIADTVEVQSAKEVGGGLLRSGFIMNAKDIETTIKAGNDTYYPVPIPDEKIVQEERGTRIVISDLQHGINATAAFLRKRLARRFSVIGDDFQVFVNEKQISIEDRDYFPKIQFLWEVGEVKENFIEKCSNVRKHDQVDGIVDDDKGFTINGWIGTMDEHRNVEEGNNTIVVMARGKLVHEDLLKDLKEGGVYSKYIIGEINADFLDQDGWDDIATSDRQSLKETDPRYVALKSYVQERILKPIQSKWTPWRHEIGMEKARQHPVIEEWYNSLGPDNQKYARQLFGTIEAIPIPVGEREKKLDLYRYGIIAFATLAQKQNLNALEKVQTEEDFHLLRTIVHDMDQLEEAHYYDIVKVRLGVLDKFQRLVDANVKEKVLQEHIFSHLWLLDPSWERASTDIRMEQSVTTEFNKIEARLSKQEKAGRIDIRYKTAAGKHIIVELKRYGRSVTATELVEQIDKYRRALKKCLMKAHSSGPDPYIEAVCVIGDHPKPQDMREVNTKILAAANARYITYDDLIRQTRDSYGDYLEAQKEIARIQVLVDSLETKYARPALPGASQSLNETGEGEGYETGNQASLSPASIRSEVPATSEGSAG